MNVTVFMTHVELKFFFSNKKMRNIKIILFSVLKHTILSKYCCYNNNNNNNNIAKYADVCMLKQIKRQNKKKQSG